MLILMAVSELYNVLLLVFSEQPCMHSSFPVIRLCLVQREMLSMIWILLK